jgi:hypothetical protein
MDGSIAPGPGCMVTLLLFALVGLAATCYFAVLAGLWLLEHVQIV